MKELTFGFMDPERGSPANSVLFVRLRTVAIKSFAGETVCSLESFAGDSIADSHEALVEGLGHTIGALRDSYYRSLSDRQVPIRLPDVQAYFVYAFTAGVNEGSILLLEPDDILPARSIPSEEVLSRRFPMRGPEWLCRAVNREMLHVENVFCYFQNEILRPIGDASPLGHRLLADAIAGTFLWAFFGGHYWLKEAIETLCNSFSLAGGKSKPSGMAMYQVKRTMQMLCDDDIERVMAASRAYQKDR